MEKLKCDNSAFTIDFIAWAYLIQFEKHIC